MHEGNRERWGRILGAGGSTVTAGNAGSRKGTSKLRTYWPPETVRQNVNAQKMGIAGNALAAALWDASPALRGWRTSEAYGRLGSAASRVWMALKGPEYPRNFFLGEPWTRCPAGRNSVRGTSSQARSTSETAISGILPDVTSQRPSPSKRCIGCGAMFQWTDATQPGWIPFGEWDNCVASRKKTLTGTSRHLQPVDLAEFATLSLGHPVTRHTGELAAITRVRLCRRCHLLQHGGVDSFGTSGVPGAQDSILPALSAEKKALPRLDLVSCGWNTSDVATEPAHRIVPQMVDAIRPGSLLLHVIDIMDFESSIVPELHEACRLRHFEMIWVINKVDCLPQNSWNIKDLLRWARRFSKQMGTTPIDRFAFVSAKTGFNFSMLESLIQSILGRGRREIRGRYLYIVGRSNAGKSAVLNRFLKHVGYKHAGTLDVRHGWGGATQTPIPGSTATFNPFSLGRGFKLVDTPGIPCSGHLWNVLWPSGGNWDQMKKILIRDTVRARLVQLTEGQSLLIGNYVRLDLLMGEPIILAPLFARAVKVTVCSTYNVCSNDHEIPTPHSLYKITVTGDTSRRFSDICIAGLGWISFVRGNDGERNWSIRAPEGVSIFRRPALPLDLSQKKCVHAGEVAVVL